MNEFFRPTSFHKAKQRIASLSRLNLRSADIDFLKSRLTLLFKGYTLTCPTIAQGQELFRGRKMGSRPEYISELSYPPPDLIANFQRVNRPGRSMFYCSVGREAVFFETGVAANDHIAVSRWVLSEKIIVNSAGYHPDVFQRFKSISDHKRGWHLDSTEGRSPTSLLIDRFLANQFARQVPDGQPHEYKLSVAITEKLMGHLTISHETFPELDDSQFGGIVYPSIAMFCNTDNLAILPNFADRYLTCTEVQYYRVEEAFDDMKFRITHVDFADSWADDGRIAWKGRSPHWVVQPGEQVKIAVEDGSWVVRRTSGEKVQLI